MRYDLETLDPGMGYKLLASTVTPRPIAWVTTLSEHGVVNAAPYSFFNAMGGRPPTVALGLLAGPDGYKHTARNIIDSGEFVVNLVPHALADAMNITCVDAPADVSELTLAGLDSAPSAHIKPPRIAASPVSFECVTHTVVETGPHQTVVIGRVLAIHIADEFLLNPERGHVDTPKLDLVARMHGGGWYAHSPQMFELVRPVWSDMAKAYGSVPGKA
ncbi:MAG: flavin reductase family protein [Gemmobacter sp.]|nr:flavin reductase family protein [Gemmobacter sp.]